MNHAMNHVRFMISPELNVVQDKVQGSSQYWPVPVFPSTASSTYPLRTNERGEPVPDHPE
jgi:hypothetical protein